MGGKSYDVNAQARCLLYRNGHVPPEDSCKCGFNSWYDNGLAMRYMRFYQMLQPGYAYHYVDAAREFASSVVLLRVGMYGDVVEGTLNAGGKWEQWGYRASNQLVTDVFFDGKCAFCNARAKYVCATASAFINNEEELLPLRTYCAEHTIYGQYILQPEGLSKRNDVGIYRELPSE